MIYWLSAGHSASKALDYRNRFVLGLGLIVRTIANKEKHLCFLPKESKHA